MAAPVTPPPDLAAAEAALARSLVDRATTALGKRYAIEDLTARNRFTHLATDVRAALLAELRGERAA